jgi:hypothetical protein
MQGVRIFRNEANLIVDLTPTQTLPHQGGGQSGGILFFFFVPSH